MAFFKTTKSRPPLTGRTPAVSPWLRWFSKLTCASTLFLIFAGAMVKSTGSGLAVPDWPLSYGMLFPPMVGGVFYEHGHRMIAATVGLFTLVLAVGIQIYDSRVWVKKLAYLALGTVILQGVLGGMTVLFFLPTPISIFHGILAQIFFILSIIIAYALSNERHRREYTRVGPSPRLLKAIVYCAAVVFLQLILGALMRHTESGLAILDFPTMGGEWVPAFDQQMLANINDWRFEQDLPPVTLTQIVYHFVHRIGAACVVMAVIAVSVIGIKNQTKHFHIRATTIYLNVLVIIQIMLGALTIWSLKQPILTSLHVVMGAAILGVIILLFLRASPVSIHDLRKFL